MKKNIHVQYSPQMQEYSRIAEEVVVTDAGNPAFLFKELSEKYSFHIGCGIFKVIINGELKPLTEVLNDGDDVIFLTPISGG